MTVWESGRESRLLDHIIAGNKTIEGRLNRGKFARYQPGDIIKLRRDYRDETGALHDGERDSARVEVVAVRRYDTFLAMVETEGYRRVIPDATSIETAASEYTRFYSSDEQENYGVLAIEVTVI